MSVILRAFIHLLGDNTETRYVTGHCAVPDNQWKKNTEHNSQRLARHSSSAQRREARYCGTQCTVTYYSPTQCSAVMYKTTQCYSMQSYEIKHKNFRMSQCNSKKEYSSAILQRQQRIVWKTDFRFYSQCSQTRIVVLSCAMFSVFPAYIKPSFPAVVLKRVYFVNDNIMQVDSGFWNNSINVWRAWADGRVIRRTLIQTQRGKRP